MIQTLHFDLETPNTAQNKYHNNLAHTNGNRLQQFTLLTEKSSFCHSHDLW